MFRNELAKEIEKIERKIKELENKLDFVFSNSEPEIAFYPLSMDGKSWQITKEFILIKWAVQPVKNSMENLLCGE